MISTLNFAKVFEAQPEKPSATSRDVQPMSLNIQKQILEDYLWILKEKKSTTIALTQILNQVVRKHEMLPLVSAVVNLEDELCCNGNFFFLNFPAVVV